MGYKHLALQAGYLAWRSPSWTVEHKLGVSVKVDRKMVRKGGLTEDDEWEFGFCQLKVCWNNAYRKVFGMHAWDSVKELQFFCKRLNFRHVCFLKKFLFLHKLLHRLDNTVLKKCFSLIVSLQNLFLCVKISMLSLTSVLHETFSIKYLIILVV